MIASAAALLLLAALPAAAFLVNVASAQGGTPTPGTGTVTDYAQAFWQALANRLGISTDTLQQAFKNAGKDTVAQELQAGKITQDQANQLNQRIDGWQPGQGDFDFPFGKGMGLGRGMGRDGFFGGQVMLDAAAKALNMTSADLTTELQSGKSLADVAKEKNVDVNSVKQAMIDAAKAQVDAEVTAGKITADQATQIKSMIDQKAANWDLTQPFFFRGSFGGHGRGHGGWGGAPGQAPSTPAQPSATPSGPSA